MKIQTLKELDWMTSFKVRNAQTGVSEGHILRKSALIQGDKVGVLNPFGQIIYLDKDTPVNIIYIND